MQKTIPRSGIQAMAVALLLLGLAGCGGGGDDGGSLIAGGPTPGQAGDTVDDPDNPDVVNGFDLGDARLTLAGPDAIGAGGRATYVATLRNSEDIPPDSPPGIRIDIDATAGSTSPAEGATTTDEDGRVEFEFRAPANDPGEGGVTITASVDNADGEQTLLARRNVDILNSAFEFTAPPDETQVRLDEPRELRFNWVIGSDGATTGSGDSNPSSVTLTLSGRPAGGGFRIGGGSSISDPAVVNVRDGSFASTVEVVAGDAGGPVDIRATASTESQPDLEATLPVVFVGEPARIELTPEIINIGAGRATILRARVFDDDSGGNALSGIPLSFIISVCRDGTRNTVDCPSGDQITRDNRTTDADGETVTGFIAGAFDENNIGGEITATVSSGPGQGLERVAVYNVEEDAPDSGDGDDGGNGDDGGAADETQQFNTPAEGARIPTGETREAVFRFTRDGQPVTGEDVEFSISRDQIDDNPNAAPPPASSRTFTTNNNGEIRFQLFSNQAGDATLTGGSASVDIEFIATLNDIAVRAEESTIAPGETNRITATALDRNGDPVEGVFIQFFIDANNGGSRSPADGISNAQGEVTTTFTAGSQAPRTIVIRAANQDQSIQDDVQFQVEDAP